MTDALPSWTDGPTRSSVLAFIQAVTTPGAGYVPPAARVAAFDNDGTLWTEKPAYVQAEFVLQRWAAMLRADPGLAGTQPFKAVADGDRAWLAALTDHVPELLDGLGKAFGGITTSAFEAQVQGFFAEARNPTLGRP